MPRTGILKEDVIEAIEALLKSNQALTSEAIRTYLGQGSHSTIQKHFKHWREQAFEQFVGVKKTFEINQNPIQIDLKAIDLLKEKLLEKETYQKTLSNELVKKEQENQKLLLNNEKLAQNLSELTESHKHLSIEHQGLKAKYQDLKAERESTLDRILSDKNAQIKRLQMELKTVNKQNLKAIKDLGQQGDELLISEKAKTIYLKDALREDRKKVALLEDQLKKAIDSKAPLLEKIKHQQKLIRRTVSWEQLKKQTDGKIVKAGLNEERDD